MMRQMQSPLQKFPELAPFCLAAQTLVGVESGKTAAEILGSLSRKSPAVGQVA